MAGHPERCARHRLVRVGTEQIRNDAAGAVGSSAFTRAQAPCWQAWYPTHLPLSSGGQQRVAVTRGVEQRLQQRGAPVELGELLVRFGPASAGLG